VLAPQRHRLRPPVHQGTDAEQEDQEPELPGSGNEDVPQDATQFNWTVFCAGDGGGTCEGDSSDVGDIMNGGGNDTVVYVDDDIGPLNAGSHTTLLDSGSSSLVEHIGESFPVPIVDDAGNMVGFGYFHLIDRCINATDVDYVDVWGISRNTRRYWNFGENEARLGYVPKQDAEIYAAEILKQKNPLDPIAQRHQGGGFVTQDFTPIDKRPPPLVKSAK